MLSVSFDFLLSLDVSELNFAVDDFDITVSDLPEKLGFFPEFRKELKAVGGSPHNLAVVFEHHSDDVVLLEREAASESFICWHCAD